MLPVTGIEYKKLGTETPLRYSPIRLSISIIPVKFIHKEIEHQPDKSKVYSPVEVLYADSLS